jgi:glycosyltransferase involved in cell wall biosynthesis
VVPVKATPEARAAFRAKHKIPKDAMVVLFMSRVDYKKGLEFLIPSLAVAKKKHPALWFVMAGSGDAEFVAGIRRLAQESGILPWMTETGFVSGADKQGALSAADLFGLPSLNENFGIVLVEAMSAGLPLLISDQVYIHSEVANAGAGAVCRPSVTSCQEALLAMLAEPERLREMGSRGLALAEGSFSVTRASQGMLDVYSTAIRSSVPDMSRS